MTVNNGPGCETKTHKYVVGGMALLAVVLGIAAGVNWPCRDCPAGADTCCSDGSDLYCCNGSCAINSPFSCQKRDMGTFNGLAGMAILLLITSFVYCCVICCGCCRERQTAVATVGMAAPQATPQFAQQQSAPYGQAQQVPQQQLYNQQPPSYK